MVHPPLVSPERELRITVLSYCGHATALSQLVPLVFIGLRFIQSGATTGDDMLPHVVDWISSALSVYIAFIGPLTHTEEVFGLVASLIALATHSVFLAVYWRYSAPDDRITIEKSCSISALIVGFVIFGTWTYEHGMARVAVASIIAACFAYIYTLLSFGGLVRAYLDPERHIDILTLVDAWLATVHAGIVFGTGQVRRSFMHTHLARLVLGFCQIVGYTIIRRIRPIAGEQEQDQAQDIEMQPLPSSSSTTTPSQSPPPQVEQEQGQEQEPPPPQMEQEQRQDQEPGQDVEMSLPASSSSTSAPPQSPPPQMEQEPRQEQEPGQDVEMSVPPSAEVLQAPPLEEEADIEMQMPPPPPLSPSLPSSPPLLWVAQPPAPRVMPTHIRQYVVACFLACYHIYFRILLG